MILHIPHSGTTIPQSIFDDLLVSKSRLQLEIAIMTDHHCDDLFQYPNARRIVVPWSRLFCDVERFQNDAKESMSAYGQGMFYTKTFSGEPLRIDTHRGRREAGRFYRRHHRALARMVEEELAEKGAGMIVDCHSFSKNIVRAGSASVYPDVCIGADAFHTPPDLVDALLRKARALGYSAAMNHPFSGSIVPMQYYKENPRVVSVMIEINRSLYLNGDTSENPAVTKRQGNYARNFWRVPIPRFVIALRQFHEAMLAVHATIEHTLLALYLREGQSPFVPVGSIE